MKTNKEIEKEFENIGMIKALKVAQDFQPFQYKLMMKLFFEYLSQLRQQDRQILVSAIDYFAQHCKEKLPQYKCSACIVLGDLKLKLNLL